MKLRKLSYVVLLAAPAWAGGGCSLFSDSGASGEGSDAGTGGVGIGGSCRRQNQCKPGLICSMATMTCQPMSDKPNGSPCILSAECVKESYCNPAGVCDTRGKAKEGESCSSEGDCETPLTCVLEGLYGKCSKPGTGDRGATCKSNGDCLAGLVCRNSLCGAAVPPAQWPGASCGDTTEEAIGKVYFQIPRISEPPSEDFYRLPFPNDIRMKDGHVSLAGHPHPGVQVLPVDVVERYLSAAEKDLTGFSTNPVVYFRFSKLVDFGTLGADSIDWYDVTPGSPDYGQPHSLTFFADAGRGKYICPRWMAVYQEPGNPMRGGTTYAVVLRNSIKDDKEKKPLVRDDHFEIMLAESAPSAGDLLAAWNAYAPLRAFIKAGKLDPKPIVAAAVFTTQKPLDPMSQMRKAVRGEPVPEVKGLVNCSMAGAVSPCDDGKTGMDKQRGCIGASANFDEYQGKVSVPVYQQGTPPYLNPEDGGGIALDATGMPKKVRNEDVCFSLAVPKGAAPVGGWPLVLYSHGTGGTYRSGIELWGDDLAKSTPKAAVLSWDGVLHGERKGMSTRSSDDLVYNFLNPRAARDNFLQGGADILTALRLGEAGIGSAKFDTGKVAFFGHSQGATHGALAVVFEPGLPATVFTGQGGDLRQSLLSKTKPVNIAGALPVILSDFGEVTMLHPMLNILQMYFDRADPVNYAGHLFREPVMGGSAHHVVHIYGTADNYSPVPTGRAFARAGSFPAVMPVIDDFGLPKIAPPVTGNFPSGTTAVTAVHAQYMPGMDYDGHFVGDQNAAAHAAILKFIGTAQASGTPTFTP